MKMIILEGIATSGKSTLTERIKGEATGLRIRVATEAETHIPIMRKTDELHVAFFELLIEKLVSEKPGLIIFDRLYLTQAFRAGAKLDEYAPVERMLSQYDALTVFLKVDEQAIAQRISKAAVHRDPSWGEYVKTKGSTENDIANYYITQQRNQIELLGASTLPYVICNTTSHDYSEIAQQLLAKLQLT